MDDCLKHGFLGPEKSGKTFAGLYQSRKEPLIIRLNPTREKSMSEGAHVVASKDALVSAVKTRDRKKKTVICWDISARLDGFEAFDFACRVAIACRVDRDTQERCAIFLNEGESLFPKSAKLTPHVNQVIRQGRQHCLVPLYWTAQRPRDVNLQLRNNSNFMNFFRNNDDSYVDFVKSKADKEASERVKVLEKYSFIRTTTTGDPWKVVKKVQNLKS